jgi:hypothetical protein
MVNGPTMLVGSVTGTPPIDKEATVGAPRSIDALPEIGTDVDVPGGRVLAITVVPFASVTLTQQAALVAPTVSVYEVVTGLYVADDPAALTGE